MRVGYADIGVAVLGWGMRIWGCLGGNSRMGGEDMRIHKSSYPYQ